jgi:hypothetical protein
VKLALAPLALLVGLSLAACGSDDTDDAASDAPAAAAGSSSAASTPFCDAIASTATLQDGGDVAALRDKLEASGIPDDAGADAQAGLDVFIDLLGQVDEDATAQDLATMEDPKLSKEEQSQVDAMVTYATTTCTAAGGENSDSPESPAPSDPASESSSESPSPSE